MRSPRLMVIGLDCASPRLVFERYCKRMPHVAALMSRGVWGPLWSTVPPITVPAWACMTSGRDPGELGIYGFRDRNPHTYGMRLVDSRHVHVPRAWDYLGDVGKKVGVLFVPPSYPPSPVVNGAVRFPTTPGIGITLPADLIKHFLIAPGQGWKYHDIQE